MKKIIVICLVVIMIIINGIVFDVMNNNGHSGHVGSVESGAKHE